MTLIWFFHSSGHIEIIRPVFKRFCSMRTQIFIFIRTVVRINFHYYHLLLSSFSHQRELILFHWSLSDSMSPEVSRTLLSILAVLNNAVAWMVSTRPLTSKSSSPLNLDSYCSKSTNQNLYNCHLHLPQFFNSQARSMYLSFFSHSFSFILWSAGTAMSTILQVLFLLLISIRSVHLAEIRWSVCMSKSHWSLRVPFCSTVAGLRIYHLLVCTNFNFLHISRWITLPTQSCLVLYFFLC